MTKRKCPYCYHEFWHDSPMICPECGHECWHKPNEDDWIYCPECGAKLNEQSHGDASEDSFKYMGKATMRDIFEKIIPSQGYFYGCIEAEDIFAKDLSLDDIIPPPNTETTTS